MFDLAKTIQLNDAFRLSSSEDSIEFSEQILNMSKYIREEIVSAMKKKQDFPQVASKPNERDYGKVFVQDQLFVWYIWYLDKEGIGISIDPSDEKITTRVLRVRTEVEILRYLNDNFRRNFSPIDTLKSSFISRLTQSSREAIYDAIRFHEFGDEPRHPEHEFGIVTVGGNRIVWQIRYRTKESENIHFDPCNSSLAQRVMDICTATENTAYLNDVLRRYGEGGKIVATKGIRYLSPAEQFQIIDAVRRFDDFNEGNDPYGEHDFGKVIVCGHEVFWKIDYYDSDMQFGSEEPCDESVTTRVMTIMFANEY